MTCVAEVKCRLWQKQTQKRKCWPTAFVTNPKYRVHPLRRQLPSGPRLCRASYVASIALAPRWSHAKYLVNLKRCVHPLAKRLTRQQVKSMGVRDLSDWLNTKPRRVFALLSLACIGMLSFGMYLQHVVGLVPCPMCIVQRYALFLIAIIAALTSVSDKKSWQLVGSILLLSTACFGAFVAARQTWLQWYPPEVMSCGRDFYGMIETFPLQRALPMIFKGGGDCTNVDWTFLGGSIANWSLVSFFAISVLALALIWHQIKRR